MSEKTFETMTREEEEKAGIPPDEQLYGQYLSKKSDAQDVPDETSEPEEAAAEPTTEEEAEQLLAGKYKTPEELERAYLEAQRLIGSLRDSQGKLSEQLTEKLDQLRGDLGPVHAPDPSSIDEMLADDPRRVVAHAIQTQDGLLYERGMRAWFDEDAYAATMFAQQQMAASMQQQMAASMQPAQQATHQQELRLAVDNVRARHEDFAEIIGTLTEDRLSEIVGGGFPQAVLDGLNGDLAGKEKVLETLYRWVKAEQTGTVSEAARAAASRQIEETRKQKQEATVASASQTTPAEVPEGEAERLARVWKEQDVSLRTGWTGRETRS